MLLFVENFDSFTYNLTDVFVTLGQDVRLVRNDNVTVEECLAMQPDSIVIGPGPGIPEAAGISKALVKAAADADIPVLGICLGHQCIAEVFGAKITRALKPVHGKTSILTHDGQGCFHSTWFHKTMQPSFEKTAVCAPYRSD